VKKLPDGRQASGGNACGLSCTFWDMEACACVSHCILCVGVLPLWKGILMPGLRFVLEELVTV
jgi:hypothetical protein